MTGKEGRTTVVTAPTWPGPRRRALEEAAMRMRGGRCHVTAERGGGRGSGTKRQASGALAVDLAVVGLAPAATRVEGTMPGTAAAMAHCACAAFRLSEPSAQAPRDCVPAATVSVVTAPLDRRLGLSPETGGLPGMAQHPIPSKALPDSQAALGASPGSRAGGGGHSSSLKLSSLTIRISCGLWAFVSPHSVSQQQLGL